jgi:hypothetical protein
MNTLVPNSCAAAQFGLVLCINLKDVCPGIVSGSSTTHLGHDGNQCLALADRWNLFEEDEPEDQLEPEDLPFVSGPEFQPKENTMVIVDKSGVHSL